MSWENAGLKALKPVFGKSSIRISRGRNSMIGLEKTLGEIAAIQTGPFGSQLHQSDYSVTGTPVVMPKDIQTGKISEANIARVTDDHVKRLSRHKLKKGDIVYSRRGDVGRCGYINEHEENWLCGTGCLRVAINPTMADSKFIFYQLQQSTSIQWVEKHAVGSTMLNLNTEILSNVPILLPPLAEQRRIADILSAYDDLIENNRKQIKLLEEAAQRLYKEWFIDLHFPGYEHTKIINGIPEGWKKEFLTDIADIQYGYAFDGSLFNDKAKGTPIIRIRNIPMGVTNDYTTEEANNQYLVNNGEIVVGMDGEFHINTWGGETAYLVQRTCCLRPKKEIQKGYLLLAIHDPIKFFEKTVVGSTVAHLGKKHLDTIMILIPPDKFIIMFHSFFEKRQLLLNKITKLISARDHLLPKLMNGKIEVREK